MDYLNLQVSEQRDYVIHYAQTPLEEEEDKGKGLANIPVSLVTSHAGEVGVINKIPLSLV